jgi:2-desacetyl-2-hydroxyethyl bacteriochlorophyllide A dehydrogenase
MKTLVCVQPGSLEYATEGSPLLQKDHSIIKVKRIGICGTDLHAFEGTQPYFDYPRILGHELSGELVETDNASGFKIGEAVTVIPYFHCGTCIACRSGKENACMNLKVCGVHQNGGMVEFLSVPSYALVHGEGLGLDALALIEPLAIGAHGIKRAGVKKGEFVLVVGAGPIGLGAMEFARIAGANVIALDINSDRLQFCEEHLKIAHTVNGFEHHVSEQLKKITGGDMPTVVIDATGNLKSINQSFQYMAHGARYVLIGLQKGDICFNQPEFHKREGTLMSSRNAVRADFEDVIRAMKEGQIDPAIFITHRVLFDEVGKRFPEWLHPATRLIKVMIEMN